jgi:beta-lactamase regulating signal transducer with metallopeptidase domain
MGWWNAPGTLGLVLEYFLKTTAVLALALLAAAAARRRPAAFRHFVLSIALVGLLLLPILSLAPVGWRTALLPARPAGLAARAPAPARPDATGARIHGLDVRSVPPGAGGLPESGLSSAAGGPAVAATGLSSRGTAVRSPRSSALPPSDLAASRPPVGGAVEQDQARILGVSTVNSALAVLWAAGLVILVLRLAIGLAGAIKLTAQGEALDDPVWRVILDRFSALISLRRKVRLKSHPEVLVPLTWGWRKPVILMPAGTEGWTEEERSSALFHELSHVKRADFLVMLAVRASLAAFWWNPLCWVVYRELRKEQEIACDELVLRAGIKPSTYAATLLAFRRSAGFRWNPSAALLGMLGKSSFHERVAAILKQKLTFKEVTMRTRIMLAAAVVLAVALVGTARPAVGIEKTAVTTIVVETPAPVADAMEIALPAAGVQETQTEKAVVQEKEKEKAKAAEKAKNKFVITITEGDVVKTLTLDKPLTITTGEGVLVLSSEGKEIQVLKGEPLRLEIKGGGLEVMKEGRVLKVGPGGAYKIVKEVGDEGGAKIVFYGTPEGKIAGEGHVVKIIKEGEAEEAAPEIFVKRMKDKKEGEKWVAVETAKEAKAVKEGEAGIKVVVEKQKEGSPTIAWTVKESGKEGKEGAVWVTKEFAGKPVAGTWVSEGGKAFAFSSATDKDMLEKVHALQEQVAAIKAKKMDITALEESLKKLEAELKAKEEKLREFEYKFDKVPGEFTFTKRSRGDEAEGKVAVWVAEKDKAAQTARAQAMGRFDDEAEGTINLIFTGQDGEAGKAAFERAIATLKKELPEGFKLVEKEFDVENGTMTFKIAAPEGKKTDETLVRKLVDSLKDAIKTKK